LLKFNLSRWRRMCVLVFQKIFVSLVNEAVKMETDACISFSESSGFSCKYGRGQDGDEFYISLSESFGSFCKYESCQN
jgi:hypothetical protein